MTFVKIMTEVDLSPRPPVKDHKDKAMPSSRLCNTDVALTTADSAPSSQLDPEEEYVMVPENEIPETRPTKRHRVAKRINRGETFIGDYLNKDIQSINVKTLRCLVPQQLILLQYGIDGLNKKKKHKGLWVMSHCPADWDLPQDYFRDPNNKPKLGQDELRRVYEFFKKKLLQMYPNILNEFPKVDVTEPAVHVENVPQSTDNQLPTALLSLGSGQIAGDLVMQEGDTMYIDEERNMIVMETADHQQVVHQVLDYVPNVAQEAGSYVEAKPENCQDMFHVSTDTEYANTVITAPVLPSVVPGALELPSSEMNTARTAMTACMPMQPTENHPVQLGEDQIRYLHTLEARTTEKLVALRETCKNQQLVSQYEETLRQVIVPLFQRALMDRECVGDLVQVIHKVESPIETALIMKESMNVEGIITELQRVIDNYHNSVTPSLTRLDSVKLQEYGDDRKVPEVGMEVQVYMAHHGSTQSAIPQADHTPFFPPMLESLLAPKKQPDVVEQLPQLQSDDLTELDEFDLSEFIASIDGVEVTKDTMKPTALPPTDQLDKFWNPFSPATKLSGKLNKMCLESDVASPPPAATSCDDLGIHLVNADSPTTPDFADVEIKQEPVDEPIGQEVQPAMAVLDFKAEDIKIEEVPADEEKYIQSMFEQNVIDLQSSTTSPDSPDVKPDVHMIQENPMDTSGSGAMNEVDIINLVDEWMEETQPGIKSTPALTPVTPVAPVTDLTPRTLMSRLNSMLSVDTSDTYSQYAAPSGVASPQSPGWPLSPPAPVVVSAAATTAPPAPVVNIPTTVAEVNERDQEVKPPTRRASRDALHNVQGGKVMPKTQPKKRGRPRKYSLPHY